MSQPNLFDLIFASCSSVRSQRGFVYHKGIVWEELLLFLELQTRRLVWTNVFTEMITYFFSALHTKTCNPLTGHGDSPHKFEFYPASLEICNICMRLSFAFCPGCPPSPASPPARVGMLKPRPSARHPAARVYAHPSYMSLAKET